MRQEMKPFPLVSVKGSWHDMGVEYGRDCAGEIVHMIGWWDGIMKAADPDFDLNRGMTLGVEKYQAALEKYSPRVVEFMKGIAEGSGVTYEAVMFVNAASELMGGSSELGGGIQGCTTFAVESNKAAGGKTILAQNMDWHTELKVVALRMEPDDAPAALTFTFAGNTPQIGISKAGYGLMVNSLLCPVHTRGVIMYALCTEALFQPNFEAGMEAVTMADRAMAFNYCFANADGSLLDLETRPDDFAPVEKENGIVVHSNHFVTERFQKEDLSKVEVDTFIRRNQATKMLEAVESVTLDDVKSVLRDHHGDKSCAICCHPDPNAESYAEAYGSILSAIAVIEDGIIFASEYPCQNDYTEYRL